MNFKEAINAWKSNDDWQYADKEAAWAFFYAEGKRAPQEVISAQCVKMNQYEKIIASLREENDAIRRIHAENIRVYKISIEATQEDAAKWRDYVSRKQQVIGAGMGRNILRSSDLPDDYEVK